MNQEQISRLRELKGLLDAGVLNQEEFDAAKKKLLEEDDIIIQCIY